MIWTVWDKRLRVCMGVKEEGKEVWMEVWIVVWMDV